MSFQATIATVEQRVGTRNAILMSATALLALGATMLFVDPLFVIAGAFALLGAGIVLSQPYIGVLLYIFLLYARPGDMFPQLAPLRLTLVGVALLSAAYAVQVLVYRKARLVMSAPLLMTVAYMGVIGLSMMGSYNKGLTLDSFMNVLRMTFMFFIIVQLVDSVPRLKGFMTTMTLIMAGLSTTIVIRYFAFPDTRIEGEGGSGGIAGGFLGDGNDYALAQNVFLPWAFLLASSYRSRFVRALMVYAVAIGVMAVFVTYSRGGFLGMIAVILGVYALWVARSTGRAVRALVGIVGLGVAVIVFLSVAPPDFLERLGTIKDYDQDESAMGRIDAWRASRAMFEDHTFLGVGAGAFSEAYGKKYKPYNATSLVWREAHSVFFEVLGELGLFGILTFYGLVIAIIMSAYGLRGAALADPGEHRFFHGARYAIYLSMIGWLSSSFFLSVAYYPHLFVLAMVVGVLGNLAKTRRWELPMIEEIEIVEEEVI